MKRTTIFGRSLTKGLAIAVALSGLSLGSAIAAGSTAGAQAGCAQSVNIAPGGAATQSSEFRAGSPFGASNAVDGDLTNFTHTAATQANPRWELEFDSENTIEQVVLHNRAGFESRLRDVVVTVRDSSGRVTYNSGILNPENALNSPARIVVDLPAPVLGQSVRVDRIADPDLSGSGGVGGRSEPNVLSLAEVVVQGCTVAPSTGAIDWSAPQNTTDRFQLIGGDVVLALNGGPSVTINTGGPDRQSYDFVGTDYTDLTFSPNVTSKVFTNAGSSTTGSPQFDTILNSFAYTTNGVTNGVQTITGLTPGRTYNIQVFFNDQRAASSGRSMTFSSNGSQSVTVRADGNGRGQNAIGTFVATGSTMDLRHIANGSKNVHFTAILVTEGASTPGTTNTSWVIDNQSSWQAAQRVGDNVSVSDGFVQTNGNGTFRSITRTFDAPQTAESIVFEQGDDWDNWNGVSNVGPSAAGDALVLLPVGDGSAYLLGLGNTGGYHAWYSTDMVNWTERGPVTPPGDGRWVTSAEFLNGQAYIYADAPNDQTPHLFIDSNLDDGIPGASRGDVFEKGACGSDASIFRDDADGLFHLIYEDWSPINARQNSWDSPLAGHTTSADGINGFTYAEHAAPVDVRTTPTGRTLTYSHPQIGTCSYQEHAPGQDAFGDWTTIKVGEQYHLFGDFDSHDGGIQVGRFTSDSIYEEFEFNGQLGNGHPDPTVGFANGQFYLITQQNTDYVSPGPWVDGVEARVGVDVDGNGSIDEWTSWQSIEEDYNLKRGFSRVVETTPAEVNLSGLPAGLGFQFQFRLDNSTVSAASPIIDRVEMEFSTR